MIPVECKSIIALWQISRSVMFRVSTIGILYQETYNLLLCVFVDIAQELWRKCRFVRLKHAVGLNLRIKTSKLMLKPRNIYVCVFLVKGY